MIFAAINNIINFALYSEALNGQVLTAQGYLFFTILSVAIELVFFVAYYTLRSIGLYTMVKNKGGANPALAIIPFYGLYLANTLAPESKYVRKNEWYYIIAIVLGVVSAVSAITLDVMYGLPSLATLISGKMFTPEMIGYSNYLTTVIDIIYSLTTLGYAICVIMVFKGVFMSYAFNKGGKYILWIAVVYFFTNSLILLGLFTFIIRNNKRYNYDEYFERMSRARQSGPYGPYGGMGGNPYGRGNPYGGNPYGRNPYGGQGYGGNPYGRPSGWTENNQNQNNQTEQPADPFEEFSNGQSSNSNNNGSATNNSNTNDNSDDFFS